MWFQDNYNKTANLTPISKSLLDTAPKELLGLLVQLDIVADPVEPQGGSQGQDVGEGESQEKADTEGRLVVTTESKLLLTLNTAVEARGEVGIEGVEGAEGQIPSSFLIPLLLAPEDEGTRMDQLLDSGEGIGECKC